MKIENFLKQFSVLLQNKQFSKKQICEVLFHVTKKEFKEQDIKVVKDILYIRSDLFVKQRIILHKQSILSKINNSQKEFYVKDIK